MSGPLLSMDLRFFKPHRKQKESRQSSTFWNDLQKTLGLPSVLVMAMVPNLVVERRFKIGSGDG